LITYDSGANGH
jgi:hypothetical protein